MYRIGIDLGGTNIKAGVVDDQNRIVASATCKTALPRPAEAIVQDMARMAREAVESANLTMDEMAYIGVGSPGTCNGDTGIVEYSNNLGFENVPLCDLLHEMTGKKIYIENDANAAALGEVVAGAAKGAHSCICITLGTGVGGGIIIDGKIYGGFNFAGAELGHTVITLDGDQCTCGRFGCWEAYASATALINQTKRAMKSNPDSKMWGLTDFNVNNVNGRTAFDAMREGDETGKYVVKKYIQYVACGLINMINIFQPEIICIGGGICKEGDTLLNPLKEYIKAERYSKFSVHQTKLCIAQLGNDAGIIGAANLGD